MKPASSATLAILGAGQPLRLDIYSITLAGGSPTYYFTTHQIPVLYGGNLYQTGLLIKRGSIKQKAGLEVQSMDLTITPQADNGAGPVFVGNYPFLTACAQRVFDGARVLMSKMFLSSYDDLSPGAVPWYQGRVNKVGVGRLSATLSINTDIEMLNTQGPPNLLQSSCVHTLFDPGCALKSADFQVSGSVTGTSSTVLNVTTSLTNPGTWFRLGRIQFTTGANAGVVRFVKDYSAGAFMLARPLPNVPVAGDAFVALPGCPKTLAACINTDVSVGPAFNNLKHNKSFPLVPVPETIYDGGTPGSGAGIPTLGGQGGGKVGSPFASGIGQRGLYKA